MAQEYGVKTKIVWLKTSIKVCQNRNEKSKEGQKVPSEVINRMASMVEDPVPNKEDNIEVIEIPKRKNGYRAPFSNYYEKEIMSGLDLP